MSKALSIKRQEVDDHGAATGKLLIEYGGAGGDAATTSEIWRGALIKTVPIDKDAASGGEIGRRERERQTTDQGIVIRTSKVPESPRGLGPGKLARREALGEFAINFGGEEDGNEAATISHVA